MGTNYYRIKPITEEQRQELHKKLDNVLDNRGQKWLRIKHNIHIVVDANASGWYYSLCKADNGTFIYASYESGPNEGGCWDSYEECLNDAIFVALKLI